MPHKFAVAITEYREAHQWCEVLTGDALSVARDEETEALDALIRTPSECLGDIRRQAHSAAETHAGRTWFDGRDFQLLDSLRRDVKAMLLKWQG